MKYENKTKVDELCSKIEGLKDKIETVKNARKIIISVSSTDCVTLSLNEDDFKKYENRFAYKFAIDIIAIYKDRIEGLERELEKL